MKQILFLAALAGLPAQAATFASGDVVVVEDTTGALHQYFDLDNGPGFSLLSPGGQFCRDGAKAALAQFGDQYDGVFAFTTESLNDLLNVQNGQPVRWSDQGIGANTMDWGAQYGSAAKLSHCAFMGALGRLPGNPDGPATALLGLPLGLSAVELMGHEYGHHWLVWVGFDQNDGKGTQYLLRGFESGSPNGHYNYYADGLSVMYSNKLTDLGGGSFKIEGGDHKYSQLDQYLMGLRGPSEVSPLLVVDVDGSGQGSPSVPHARGSSDTFTGARVDVAIADVIRAHGARSPAYPNAQSCWRVAFVLVGKPGTTPSAADIAKVDAYRQRWESWFSSATDGRGRMDTRLFANGCAGPATPGTDAGTPAVDAGQPADAGTPGPDDAGTEPGIDAGLPEEFPETGGAGGGPSGPSKEDTRIDLGTTKLKPGCGCTGAPEVGLWALLALAALARRRRA